MTNPLKQSSLQHDTAKDRYINASTTSSKPSVIDDGVNSYEFNHRKMGYAIFIINSEFDAQKTHPFADLDYRKMSKLFSTLGFDIKILNNKTNADLKMCLAGMYALGQSLMIPIISHYFLNIRGVPSGYVRSTCYINDVFNDFMGYMIELPFQ